MRPRHAARSPRREGPRVDLEVGVPLRRIALHVRTVTVEVAQVSGRLDLRHPRRTQLSPLERVDVHVHRVE